MKNPAAVAAEWASRLGGSTQKIKDGIMAVSVSPTESALRQVDAYQQGIARAIADGRYQRGLQSVSLQDWQQAALTKGVARIAQGAAQAKPKMEAFLAQFLPHVEAGKQKLASMPRGSIDQNIARAVAMMQHNASFRKR